MMEQVERREFKSKVPVWIKKIVKKEPTVDSRKERLSQNDLNGCLSIDTHTGNGNLFHSAVSIASTTIDHIGKIYSIHNKLFIDAFPKGLFVSIKKLSMRSLKM